MAKWLERWQGKVEDESSGEAPATGDTPSATGKEAAPEKIFG